MYSIFFDEIRIKIQRYNFAEKFYLKLTNKNKKGFNK